MQLSASRIRQSLSEERTVNKANTTARGLPANQDDMNNGSIGMGYSVEG